MHPLGEDVSQLKTEDLDAKISDLSRKYMIASRLGNPQVLTQLQNLITMYRDEQGHRMAKDKLRQNDQDLDDLINVD